MITTEAKGVQTLKKVPTFLAACVTVLTASLVSAPTAYADVEFSPETTELMECARITGPTKWTIAVSPELKGKPRYLRNVKASVNKTLRQVTNVTGGRFAFEYVHKAPVENALSRVESLGRLPFAYPKSRAIDPDIPLVITVTKKGPNYLTDAYQAEDRGLFTFRANTWQQMPGTPGRLVNPALVNLKVEATAAKRKEDKSRDALLGGYVLRAITGDSDATFMRRNNPTKLNKHTERALEEAAEYACDVTQPRPYLYYDVGAAQEYPEMSIDPLTWPLPRKYVVPWLSAI